MNSHHPDEFAPLSYGAAMAVGLMLILGLPTDRKTSSREPTPPAGGPPIRREPALAGATAPPLAACGLESRLALHAAGAAVR